MQLPKDPIRLSDLPLGGRLLVRSRMEWRMAAIARISDEKVTISVSSPKGRTYRIHRSPDFPLTTEDNLFLMDREMSETWQGNFARYDVRW